MPTKRRGLGDSQEVIRGALAQGLAYPLLDDRPVRSERADRFGVILIARDRVTAWPHGCL
jgi:hypothetical protein